MRIDAETGDLLQFTTVVQEGGNSLQAIDTAALHGDYGFRASFDGINNDCYGRYNFTSGRIKYARAYFRIPTSLTVTGMPVIALQSTAGSLFCYVTINSTTTTTTIARFNWYTDAGLTYASINRAIAKDEAHCIEIQFSAASEAGVNDGFARLILNGEVLSEQLNLDNDTRLVVGARIGSVGTTIPQAGNFFDFDDFIIADEAIGLFPSISNGETGTSTYQTTYNGNGNTSGSVPVDTTNFLSGETVLLRGNTDSLDRTGFVFMGWSLTSVGSVISSLVITENTTVYAIWQAIAAQARIYDHTAVEKYSDIPQSFINIIKTKWFNNLGESHSGGVRNGFDLLMAQDSKFAVVNTDAGTPENATVTTHLRSGRGSWGDYDTASGWQFTYGEEDWFTSTDARIGTKRHIQYCHDNNFGLSYTMFGWCWDETWHTNGGASAQDPVWRCGWYGSSVGGTEGDLPWGLDSGDTSLTGNSVNMDLYIAATLDYQAYCTANGISTKVLFTTGVVDGYTGEASYQRHIKHQYIRDYIKKNGGVLFDYAAILRYSNAGTVNNGSWDTHQYEYIADDNMLDLDGTYIEDGDHIGQRGALRLAKAAWVMMAQEEGWDGNPEDTASLVGISSTPVMGVSTLTADGTAQPTGVISTPVMGITTLSSEDGAEPVGIYSTPVMGIATLSGETAIPAGILSTPRTGKTTLSNMTDVKIRSVTMTAQITRSATL